MHLFIAVGKGGLMRGGEGKGGGFSKRAGEGEGL